MDESPAGWRRVDGALHRASGDRQVVLLPGHDEPVLLSGGAAALWRHLTVPAGTEDLLGLPGVDPGVVADSLARLRDGGLVEPA